MARERLWGKYTTLHTTVLHIYSMLSISTSVAWQISDVAEFDLSKTR
jgi:hypothetical protein